MKSEILQSKFNWVQWAIVSLINFEGKMNKNFYRVETIHSTEMKCKPCTVVMEKNTSGHENKIDL